MRGTNGRGANMYATCTNTNDGTRPDRSLRYQSNAQPRPVVSLAATTMTPPFSLQSVWSHVETDTP